MNELRSNRIKTLLFVFAGAMMVAHGARMMVQGLFYPTSYYPAPLPTTLDFWFDWFFLATIGMVLFLWGLVEFYHSKKQKIQTNSEELFVPT